MKPSSAAGRTTRTFRRKRARMLAESDTCRICGHAGAKRAGHDIARAIDPTMAEDEDNLAPVHGTGNLCPTCGRNCNGEQGTRSFAQATTLKTSRDWFA